MWVGMTVVKEPVFVSWNVLEWAGQDDVRKPQ